LAVEIHAKEHKIVDLRCINGLVQSSALTNPNMKIPEGHYAAPNMKDTVVPNRNMIMYAIAVGYAVSIKAQALYVGVHAGDHFIYPDCRPQFIFGLDSLVRVANEGFIDQNFQVVAPFLYNTKAEIVKIGNTLDVPFELTWSCYKGGEIHCGKCGTDVERIEAFELAGVKDPTVYETDKDKYVPPDPNTREMSDTKLPEKPKK
jgi:7-cyano-7-deazaguanine synthase